MNSKQFHDMACFIRMVFDLSVQGFLGKTGVFGCVVEGWNKNERAGTVS